MVSYVCCCNMQGTRSEVKLLSSGERKATQKLQAEVDKLQLRAKEVCMSDADRRQVLNTLNEVMCSNVKHMGHAAQAATDGQHASLMSCLGQLESVLRTKTTQ